MMKYLSISSFSYKGTYPIMGVSWPHLNLIHKGSSANIITLGVKASAHEFGDNQKIQPISIGKLFKLGFGPGT